MRIAWYVCLAVCAGAGVALAQQPSAEELEIRARALATRRAERDLHRSQHAPSRPMTLREPLPLPVVQSVPPGGAAAGRSCPAGESCVVEFAVATGKLLVVTAIWSAAEIRCDGESAGATPASGQAIAPWWHCRRALQFTGQGAGFTGYLAPLEAGK